MTWIGERRNEEFEFYSVDVQGNEGQRIEEITGGELSLSAFSDLKQVANLDFVAKVPTAKRVRIYYSFDSNDGHVRVPLATLYTSVPTVNHDGAMNEGEMACWSTLGILAKKIYGMPFTVKSGENAIDKAVGLIEQLGLSYVVDRSAYVLTADHTFKPDDNYLTVINWLLDVAGYRSAYCNREGSVVLAHYIKPEDREPVWDFNDGETSVTYPEISEDSGLSAIPNVYKVLYQNETATYYGEARNDDPLSVTSTVSVGYENTAFEIIDELAGNAVENIKAIARKKLLDNMTIIQKAKFSCNYVPVLPDDAVILSAYGLQIKGNVTSVKIDLGVSAKTKIEIRRFIKSGIDITVIGGEV